MSPAERAVERAKNADRQAIRRALDILKKTEAWKTANDLEKEQMALEKEEEVMHSRYA